MPVVVHRERGQVPPRVGPGGTLRALVAASLVASSGLAAQGRPAAASPRSRPLQGSLERRLAQLIDVPPFDRATWGVYAVDDRGRVLYQRNADRLFVPASNTKLVGTAAALVLLPADYRVRTSLYANGVVAAGVLEGDLVFYGRGDPTFYAGCYGVDTLAAGVCDSTFTALDAIADSLRSKGLRRITGKLVGDGSYFEPKLIHPGWNAFDLNAWYAAPVSGLGFHGNSVDFTIAPGDAVDRPPVITLSPDLGLISFENRARTGPPDSNSTIEDNFYRAPGTWDIWAEGRVALGRAPWTVSVALPDPNLYAARALAFALQRRGISIEGGAASTTDSLAYRTARGAPPPRTTRHAAQAAGGHALRESRAREDRQHQPREQPLRLHRAAGRAHPHLQRAGEQPERLVFADAGANRLGGGGNRKDQMRTTSAIRLQSSVCPNSAMFELCPGSIFAAGLMKCTAWFTATAASAAPVAISLSFPG